MAEMRPTILCEDVLLKRGIEMKKKIEIYFINCTIAVQVQPEMNAKIVMDGDKKKIE
jgi:hypothetical protein